MNNYRPLNLLDGHLSHDSHLYITLVAGVTLNKKYTQHGNILNETVRLYRPNSLNFADASNRTVLTCILLIGDKLIISVNMFVVVCLIVNLKPLSNNFVNIQILNFSRSGKSATIRESNFGSGVYKDHYA